MKFFLDTANLDEIRKAAALGLADGVTTNPSLIAKEGNVDFKQHIAEICKIVSGPVSAEVTTADKDEMLRQGREYVKIAPNVVIKCPLTADGLEATRAKLGLQFGEHLRHRLAVRTRGLQELDQNHFAFIAGK